MVVQPAPVVSQRRSAPRWGIGAFAGSMTIVDGAAGSDLGLLLQRQLAPSLILEGELARSTLSEIGRRERRAGASLQLLLAPRSSLSPLVLVGMGAGRTELAGGQLDARQGYGELGLGVMYRASRRFALSVDARAGNRHTEEDVSYRSSEPMSAPDRTERFSRVRLSGLVRF